MNLRIGIVLCLILIFSGGVLYAYSKEITYSEQVPVTRYSSQQKSRYITVFSENVNNPIDGDGTIYFGPWNAINTPFDVISFNFAETDWSTYLTIEGIQKGVIYTSASEHHDLKYISVTSNDAYTLKIWNMNPDNPIAMRGTIAVFHTEYYQEQVPYTAYETEWHTYTNYPYRSTGGFLIILGIIAGIATGGAILLSKRRMKTL